MNARELASGYSTYTSTGELAAATTNEPEGARAEPTTSIASTVCITTTVRG